MKSAPALRAENVRRVHAFVRGGLGVFVRRKSLQLVRNKNTCTFENV